MNTQIFYCNKFAGSDKDSAKKIFSVLKVSKGPVYLFKKKDGTVIMSHRNKLIEGKKFIFMPQNYEAVRVEDHTDATKGPVDIIYNLKTGETKEIIRHKHF